jgi:hypothetical protein
MSKNEMTVIIQNPIHPGFNNKIMTSRLWNTGKAFVKTEARYASFEPVTMRFEVYSRDSLVAYSYCMIGPRSSITWE